MAHFNNIYITLIIYNLLSSSLYLILNIIWEFIYIFHAFNFYHLSLGNEENVLSISKSTVIVMSVAIPRVSMLVKGNCQNYKKKKHNVKYVYKKGIMTILVPFLWYSLITNSQWLVSSKFFSCPQTYVVLLLFQQVAYDLQRRQGQKYGFHVFKTLIKFSFFFNIRKTFS